MSDDKMADFLKWREENDHLLDMYNFPDECMWMAYQAALSVQEGWMQFGAKVLDSARTHMADVDGGDIQDWAEEAGLLVKHCVSESCGEYCVCAEVGFPSECYRYSDEAKVAIGQIAAAPSADKE